MSRKRRTNSKALERRLSEKSEELKRTGRTAAGDAISATKATDESGTVKGVSEKVTETEDAPGTKAMESRQVPSPSSDSADMNAESEDAVGDSAGASAVPDRDTSGAADPASTDADEDRAVSESSDGSMPSSAKENAGKSPESPSTSDAGPVRIPSTGDNADVPSTDDTESPADGSQAVNEDEAHPSESGETSHPKKPASKVMDIESTIDDGIDEAMGKIEASIEAITDDAADAPDDEAGQGDDASEDSPSNVVSCGSEDGQPATDEAAKGAAKEAAIPEFLRRRTTKDVPGGDADETKAVADRPSEKPANDGHDATGAAIGENADSEDGGIRNAKAPDEVDGKAPQAFRDADADETKDVENGTPEASEADKKPSATDKADLPSDAGEAEGAEGSDEPPAKLVHVVAETVATAAGAAASAVGDALHDAAAATSEKTKDVAKATASALADLRDRMRKASEERHRKAEERRREKAEERRLKEEEKARAEREAPVRESQTKGTEEALREAGTDAAIREISDQNDLGSLPPVRVYIPEEDEPMPRPVPHHERFSVIMTEDGMVPARPFTERELSRRVSAWAGTKERYASRRFVGVALVTVLGLGLLIGAATSLYTAHAIEEAAQRATRTINWSGGAGASYAPDANKVSDDQSGKAYRMGSDASVAVIATDASGKAVGHWSGTIVDGAGHVVVPYAAASHVGSGTVRCYTSDGKGYTAEVAGTDAQGGLAVLSIGYSTKPDAALADSSTTRVGQWAMVVSRESGTSAQAAAGIVSSIDSSSDIKDAAGASIPLTLIRTDIPADGVLAGSPVIDGSGSIIGIAVSTTESVVYAIPSNYVATSAQSILSSGSMEHASLGASFETDGNGLTISDAGTSGLSAGDTLVSVAGTAVSSESDVARVLMANKPGDTVAVTVRNARGANETVNVELTKASVAGTLG